MYQISNNRRRMPNTGPKGIPQCLLNEKEAAEESIASNIYITWIPNQSFSSSISSSAASEVSSGGTGQCCRIRKSALCLWCNDTLSNHEAIKIPKNVSFISPPKCKKKSKSGGGIKRYTY